MFTYGNFDDELRLSKRLKHRNDEDVFVLFPSKDSVTVKRLMEGEDGDDDDNDDHNSSSFRKRTIIIIDGTWSNAKAINKIPILKKYKRICLSNATRKSHINLRKHKTENHVSTLSALIHLFEELKEPQKVVSSLSQAHNLAVAQYEAQTRSKLIFTKNGAQKWIKSYVPPRPDSASTTVVRT